MNATNSTATAPCSQTQHDDSVEWQELRKKLLEQIVRADAARKKRPPTASNNHLS